MPDDRDIASQPRAPDRSEARVVVGIDLGTAASGYSFYIRPGIGQQQEDGGAAAEVQPIQAPGRCARRSSLQCRLAQRCTCKLGQQRPCTPPPAPLPSHHLAQQVAPAAALGRRRLQGPQRAAVPRRRAGGLGLGGGAALAGDGAPAAPRPHLRRAGRGEAGAAQPRGLGRRAACGQQAARVRQGHAGRRVKPGLLVGPPPAGRGPGAGRKCPALLAQSKAAGLGLCWRLTCIRSPCDMRQESTSPA
jgi:hypothetical protein